MRRIPAIAAPLSLILLAGCASAPPAPGWIHQPARVVDNGYIVYTGSGLEADPNRARLAAEGAAIQDLANECSFVPKGARVEDRYARQTNNGFEAYARLGIEFDTCEEAQRTVQPDQIRNLASAPFTDELKRYESLIMGPSQVVSAGGSPQAPAAPPAMTDDVDFFLARQYVASQKQLVILAPPGAYAPGSVQTQVYVTNVTNVIRPLQVYYARNPRLRAAPVTWSAVEPRVRQRYPRAFKAAAVRWRPRQRPNRPAPRRRGRRRR